MVQEQIVSSEKTNKNEGIYQDAPELRFPEFNDEWKTFRLGDFLEFISTNSLSRAKLNLDNGKIKNIHYGDIHTKFPTIVNVEKEEIPFINLDVDISKFKEEQYCKDGDLIIADASEDYADIGKAIELVNVNIDLVAGLHTILARDKSDNTAPGFKGYLFLTDNLRKEIKINANGISVLGISKNNITNLDVRLPSKQEQEKISSFLRAIERKIELLEKKQKAYAKFNDSIISKIFKQEILFNNKNEWEEITLGELGTFYRGHSYNSSNVVDDGLVVLRSNNIQNNKLIFDKGQLQHVNKNCKDEIKLLQGDIVICMSNGTKSLVGKNAVYEGNYNEALTVGAFCSIFRTSNPLAKYLLRTSEYKKNLYLILAGTNINNLKNEDIKKFKFNIPTKNEDINKIDEFLSSFEKKLNNINQELLVLKSFKKGLLQKMFI